jgi:uncharacterized protein
MQPQDDPVGGYPRTRRRLDYLSQTGGSEAAAGARPGAETGAPEPARPRIFEETDPRFPGWRREAEFLYRRQIVFPGLGVTLWPRPFVSEADSAEQLVFYDTETTGLSGGAGSVIFLFGAAWCEGSTLVVEQLFLSDFPGETEFLQAVNDCLKRFQAFVSYNGKTFDSHLLKTRFLMNRIEWEPGPQVDLLHHSRRLWKAITGDCSLRSIEAGILGFVREMDVAGEDIPLIWLHFLRSGKPGNLPVVFDHNVMDITSLARIYGRIGELLAGDLSNTRVDEKALGKWLLSRSPLEGAEMLSDVFERGNMEAGIELSLHHKRCHEWDRAVTIWEVMLQEKRSLFAAVELAKHHEHRQHDPERALETVDLLLSWNLPLDAHTRQEIFRRKKRLQRKLGNGPEVEKTV